MTMHYSSFHPLEQTLWADMGIFVALASGCAMCPKGQMDYLFHFGWIFYFLAHILYSMNGWHIAKFCFEKSKKKKKKHLQALSTSKETPQLPSKPEGFNSFCNHSNLFACNY